MEKGEGEPCPAGYLCRKCGIKPSEKVCDDKLQIIYKHGQPHGIRDSGGFLFFFPKVDKYTGQEERYREEIAQAYRLADFLLKSLEQYRESV